MYYSFEGSLTGTSLTSWSRSLRLVAILGLLFCISEPARAVVLTINNTSFIIDHDAATRYVSGSCQPLTQCDLTPTLTLPTGGNFASTGSYSCYASEHGAILYALSLNFYPVTGQIVQVSVFNESGSTIPSTTPIIFGYTCEGIRAPVEGGTP